MGLKKHNKVSAEFSMSSLTDIIFLLLIFFMLTSTLVRVDAVDLPESDSKTVAATSAVVAVNPEGQFKLNGKPISTRRLKASLQDERRRSDHPDNFTITIVAEKGASFDYVVKIMTIAGQIRAKAILATQPKTT